MATVGTSNTNNIVIFESTNSIVCKSIRPNKPSGQMDEHYKSVARGSTGKNVSRITGGNGCEWRAGDPVCETCVVHMTVDVDAQSTDNRDTEQTGVGQKIYQSVWGFLSLQRS